MLERAFGLPSAGEVSAQSQLQRSFPRAGIQPLPAGVGGHATPASVGITDSEPISFFVIGDSGGVKSAAGQNAVSYAMQEAAATAAPAFVYHVGDIVYYHGEASGYSPQFYEAYAHLNAPIVAIPGNHDGDVAIDDAGNPTGRQPLDTFMANFCDSTPSVPTADPQFEYGRHTQTQPYCDWTLLFQAVTIIGVYSNVPAGGNLEQSQIAWLTSELQAADAGKPVIVALHHPPYSVDATHGGSTHMLDALDGAFAAANRAPDLVLSGHVHDYQRFSRNYQGKVIPYIVAGGSGYANLHRLASGAAPGMDLGNGVTFEFGDDTDYGFLTLTVAGGKISGSYTAVVPGTMPDGSDGKATPDKDKF